MTGNTPLRHEFVRHIPERLEERTVYVSVEYATVAHRCCCGCGREVVTPLSPTDWKLIFDGRTISLHPSIGNWEFPCQSHYWITHGRVRWAAPWTADQIDAGREADRLAKQQYFEGAGPLAEDAPPRQPHPAPPADRPTQVGLPEGEPARTFWVRLKRWFFG